VALALPFGLPKMIVSTIAFSSLIPPDRLAPDVMMSLWTAGLYGVNPYCKTALNQATHAVLGAVNAKVEPKTKPIVAITSLGTSSLKYIKILYPALQARGFDVAIFHATGMGGRAMEALNKSDGFAAILDFALVEVSNKVFGSPVMSGDDRLQGFDGDLTPRIIAAGGVSLVDFQAWGSPPSLFLNREVHPHNRLIASYALTAEEREQAAQLIGGKINISSSPKTVILTDGIDEWDKPGGPFHDPAGLAGFNDVLAKTLDAHVSQISINAHINDEAFSDTVLCVFDDWIADGTIAV
ncbi:MAG: Tm-1-like ATP-binding domain-containing protein, partial [Sinobacterium sp.]